MRGELLSLLGGCGVNKQKQKDKEESLGAELCSSAGVSVWLGVVESRVGWSNSGACGSPSRVEASGGAWGRGGGGGSIEGARRPGASLCECADPGALVGKKSVECAWW